MLKLILAALLISPALAFAGDPHDAMGAANCRRMVLIDTEKTFAKLCVEMADSAKPYLIRIYRRDGSLAEHYDMAAAATSADGLVTTYYPSEQEMQQNKLDEAVSVISPKSANPNDAGIVSIKGDKFGLRVK